MDPIKVGLVGCGAISAIYLKLSRTFEAFKIVACSDREHDRACARAKEWNVPQVATVDELLQDPEIEVLLNLTVPAAHAEIALQAIRAGKSVYGEKPLAVDLEDGREIVALARDKGLRVGSAPDTFLGASHQTARGVIDAGDIGQPLGAHCFMLSSGVETWHPNPEFYYKPGGGPMFDMGPYYLTALVNMFGAVRRVTGATGLNRPQRTITSKPYAGKVIEVEVPTHIVAVLEHHSGVISTVTTSFDITATTLPNIEVYGTAGSMIVPDPNGFGGEVQVRSAGGKKWKRVKSSYKYAENSRGVGLADMASAMRSGRPHRASGELALHVLEIMHAVHTAAREGQHVLINTQPARPEPMNPRLKQGVLD